MPSVSGNVKNSSGANVSKLVRVYRRDSGMLVGSVLSDPSSGNWSVTTADTSEHFALVHDAVGNPDWEKVVLAMRMSDTGLTDLKGHSVTLNGNVTRSSAQSYYSGYSAYFDGAGDYLSVPASSDFTLANSDFDISFAINLSNTSNTSSILGMWGGSTDLGYVIYYYSGNLQFSYTTNGTTSVNHIVSPSFSTATWYRVSICRSSTNLRIFVEGSQVGSTHNIGTASIYASSRNLEIGMQSVASYGPMNGYIEDLIFTKKALHASAFTPSSSAFLQGPSGGSENSLVYDLLIPA